MFLLSCEKRKCQKLFFFLEKGLEERGRGRTAVIEHHDTSRSGGIMVFYEGSFFLVLYNITHGSSWVSQNTKNVLLYLILTNNGKYRFFFATK